MDLGGDHAPLMETYLQKETRKRFGRQKSVFTLDLSFA